MSKFNPYEVGKFYLADGTSNVGRYVGTTEEDDGRTLHHLSDESSQWTTRELATIDPEQLGKIKEWTPTRGKLYAFYDEHASGISVRTFSRNESPRFIDLTGDVWDHCRPLTDEEWESYRGY